MARARISRIAGAQVVHIPPGYELIGTSVDIRRDGEALILEPIRLADWPEDFFESIAITDPAFARPAQGEMPAAPSFDA